MPIEDVVALGLIARGARERFEMAGFWNTAHLDHAAHMKQAKEYERLRAEMRKAENEHQRALAAL